MTWYSPYNGYSNQLQYYYPSNYSSYHSTPYGTITDASFQNLYYAVDGANNNSGLKTGLKVFFGIVKLGLNVANMALGNGGGFGSSTIMTGGFPTITVT